MLSGAKKKRILRKLSELQADDSGSEPLHMKRKADVLSCDTVVVQVREKRVKIIDLTCGSPVIDLSADSDEDDGDDRGRQAELKVSADVLGCGPVIDLSADSDDDEKDDEYKERKEELKISADAAYNGLLVEAGLKGTVCLLPHQIQGIKWWQELETDHVNQKTGGLLGDATGLGKTVQSLAASLLGDEMDKTTFGVHSLGKTLVVCPLSLLRQWQEEVLRFTTLKRGHGVQIYWGKGRSVYNLGSDSRFILTTYDTVLADFKRSGLVVETDSGYAPPDASLFSEDNKRLRGLFLMEFSRMVLDEAQIVRNSRSLKFMALNSVRTKRVFALSATPFQNRFKDLSSLQVLTTGAKTHEADFKEWRQRHVLRRHRTDPGVDVVWPSLTWETLSVRLSEDEQSYCAYVNKAALRYFEWVDSIDGRHLSAHLHHVLVWLLRVRQAATHPMLLLGRRATVSLTRLSPKSKKRLSDSCDHCHAAAPSLRFVDLPCKKHRICQECASDPSSLTKPCFVCGLNSNCTPPTPHSSRLDALRDRLQAIFLSDPRARCIAFSQWGAMLDVSEACLREADIAHLRLDGTMSPEERDDVLQKFSSSEEGVVLLAAIQVGGVGLNLTCAHECFCLDEWWNPFIEQQAVARLHRMGQTHAVRAYRFDSRTVIERALKAIQSDKKQQADWLLHDVPRQESTRQARLDLMRQVMRCLRSG